MPLSAIEATPEATRPDDKKRRRETVTFFKWIPRLCANQPHIFPDEMWVGRDYSGAIRLRLKALVLESRVSSEAL
jgi:hypothetical protein